jgi:hypothetical protein
MLKFVNSADHVHRGANGFPLFPLTHLPTIGAYSLFGVDDKVQCDSALSDIHLRNGETRRATPKVPSSMLRSFSARRPAASYDRRTDVDTFPHSGPYPC